VQLANERSQASSLQTLRQASVIDSNISTRRNIEFLSLKLNEPIPLAHIFMKVMGKVDDLSNSFNAGGSVPNNSIQFDLNSTVVVEMEWHGPQPDLSQGCRYGNEQFELN
jgi:hypothetical protein